VVAHQAVLIDERALGSIDLLALPQLLPARADVEIAVVVVGKKFAQEITVTKAAMPVLREGRVIRNWRYGFPIGPLDSR